MINYEKRLKNNPSARLNHMNRLKIIMIRLIPFFIAISLTACGDSDDKEGSSDLVWDERNWDEKNWK